MWRWSFSGVRKLRDNFKPRFAFQQQNSGYARNKKLKKKKTLISLSLLMSESHWWHLLHREVKSGDWTTWFRIWQFQNVAWKRYLQMHLLAEQFVFWWDDRGYPKEKSRPIKWHQCCLLTRQLIFRHHIYTLWCIGLCKQKKLKYVQTSYTLLYAAGSFFGGQKFSGRRKNNHA
jgi:hypothetical protein